MGRAFRMIPLGIICLLLAPGLAADPGPPVDGIPGKWMQTVGERIRRSEYQFSVTPEGAWAAPNRAQGLRARFDDGGLTLTSRIAGEHESEGGWRLELRLSRFGREGKLDPVDVVRPSAEENRLEFRRERLTEWYVNDERGLEQGFTLPAPPPGNGDGPVVLEMALAGSLVPQGSHGARSVTFRNSSGEDVLHYAGLRVTDAIGNPVPARLAARPGRLQIRIDDSGAAYPLTVDPTIGVVVWAAVGSAGDALGESVATAGDVNGDGYSDVIVSARGFDNGQANEGAAFLYLGSPSGPSLSPDWTAESDNIGSQFGLSAGTAGDVNADGYDDVIIGANLYSNGTLHEGAAFLWLGGVGGMGPDGNPTNADWSYESDQTEAWLGFSVATAGDVDGDGDDDVIVGAPKATHGEQEEGRAFVFLGVPGGLAVAPAWTAESDQACTQIGSVCLGSLFAVSVAGAGDVNGDGYDDVIVGARDWRDGSAFEGGAFVWHGSAGFGTGADGNPGNVSWFAEGDGLAGSFGRSVATAGDVNGDGFADVIVGATQYSSPESNEGGAFVWHGGATGLGAIGSPLNADWKAESNLADARFGHSVATAGDVNGDGFADVVVGAPTYSVTTASHEGRAYVWLGSSGGLGADGTPANADSTSQTGAPGAQAGKAVATAGDVNGDGFSDVLVGSPAYDEVGGSEGLVVLYLGSADGPITTASWSPAGGADRAQFGFSVASAGDTNGDGYGEVIVGAPFFDGGDADEGKAFVFIGSSGGLFVMPSWVAEGEQRGALLGHAVDGGVDINSDGYSDVLVGAPGYETTKPVGSVLAWHGGPASAGNDTGLGVDGNPANSDWIEVGDQSNAQFGYAVASAGDVNGDGIGDVIAGAPFRNDESENEGRAYVYAGVGGGPPSLIWTADAEQSFAEMGAAVAAAGDLNMDGFGDVVVGAPGYSSGESGEGAAFVWLGNGEGLGPNGTPTNAHWRAESDDPGGRLGAAVSTAGDVNGDGFADLIVGAPDFTDGEAGEGAVFVWYGTSVGLASNGTPANAHWSAQANLAGAELGRSVSTAGDVNLDGFGDVVVGAPGYGNVQSSEGLSAVWLGSEFGLGFGVSGTPGNAQWKVESNQTGARFGSDVSAAGDVNGDGFGDLLVGASHFDFPNPEEGRAFVYYGGGGDGLHRIPRQGRQVSLSPIHVLGRTDTDSSFRLRLLARSPAGRANARLMWEVEPLGVPFDGTGLVLSPLALDTGAPDFFDGSAVEFDELVLGLDSGTFYRWRVRILTDSPFFPRSPWLTLASNGLTETDLRTLGCLDDDGDGYGRAPDPLCLRDPLDCDDGDSGIFPGNPEVCDDLDNDCDGTVDTFATSCGLGECAREGMCELGVDSCMPGTPSAEVCDGLDNDCDGTLPPDEVDGDGDGAFVCTPDCDDGDPGVIAIPAVVQGVVASSLGPGNGWRFTATDQGSASGDDTVYDVYYGVLSDAVPGGDFADGRCLAEDLPQPEFDESGSDPDPGDAYYFLMRGQNACGNGHWGNNYRNAGAAASPGACE